MCTNGCVRSRSFRHFFRPLPLPHDISLSRKRERELRCAQLSYRSANNIERSHGYGLSLWEKGGGGGGGDLREGETRIGDHRYLIARQNLWAAYGQSSPRWTTLTASPRSRKPTYRSSAPPKDSRYRFIGTESYNWFIDVEDDSSSNEPKVARGGDDSIGFLIPSSKSFPSGVPRSTSMREGLLILFSRFVCTQNRWAASGRGSPRRTMCADWGARRTGARPWYALHRGSRFLRTGREVEGRRKVYSFLPSKHRLV